MRACVRACACVCVCGVCVCVVSVIAVKHPALLFIIIINIIMTDSTSAEDDVMTTDTRQELQDPRAATSSAGVPVPGKTWWIDQAPREDRPPH